MASSRGIGTLGAFILLADCMAEETIEDCYKPSRGEPDNFELLV